MICPFCKKTALVVKNNYYFCPTCKIFVSSIQSNPQNFSTKAFSKLQVQPEEKVIQDAPIIQSKLQNVNYFTKKIILPSFLAFFILGIFSFYPFLNYFSISPYCNIKIEERNKEFKQDVSKYLDGIKGSDQDGYRTICKYVTNIVERKCPIADGRGSGGTSMEFKEYCYVKGTKVIYVDSNGLSNLLEAANLSRGFWEKH